MVWELGLGLKDWSQGYWGLECRVWGLGFRVTESGPGVRDAVLRVEESEVW